MALGDDDFEGAVVHGTQANLDVPANAHILLQGGLAMTRYGAATETPPAAAMIYYATPSVVRSVCMLIRALHMHRQS